MAQPTQPPERPESALATAPADRFAGVVAAWLAAKAGRSGSAKTKRAYADAADSFQAALQAVGQELDADAAAVALVAQAWAARGEPAPSTFNQRLAIISSLYGYAERRRLLPGNPIRLVERRPVQSYAAAAPLDAAAIRARLEAIDRAGLAGRRDYALLTIFLATGRRLAEVAALTLADLTTQGGRVQLVFRRAKGGKLLRDQLGAGVSAALLDWLAAYYGQGFAGLPGETPVWVSLARNGTAGRALSTRAIGLLCEARFGTSKVHALRHTFAHAMEHAGAKVSEIQARLGHANLATTGRYLAALRAADNPQSEALEALFGVGRPPIR